MCLSVVSYRGGVDSSCVTYNLSKWANTVNKRNVKLWGIGITPSDKRYSEIEYMQKAAQTTGVKLETYPLENSWVVDNWRKAVWHSDGIPEFVNDLGILKLASKARNSVTVLLSGEGADELFAGYWWIASVDKFYGLFRKYKKSGLKIAKLDKTFNRFYDTNNRSNSDDFIRDYMLYAQDAISDSNMNLICKDFDSYKGQVFKDREHIVDNICKNHNSILSRMRLRDIMLRLPVLLNRQDKMTMAFSLENRVPILDNDVIDFAFSVPEKYLSKYDGLKQLLHGHNPISCQGKYILKEIVADIFGEKFAYRNKMGFGLPIAEYIKRFISREEYKDVRFKLSKREIVNMDAFDSVIDRIRIGNTDVDDIRLAWRIISLELFFEESLDRYQD